MYVSKYTRIHPIYNFSFEKQKISVDRTDRNAYHSRKEKKSKSERREINSPNVDCPKERGEGEETAVAIPGSLAVCS